MKIVLLDGNRIKNAAELHREFSLALELPEWYGANLDALHDALCESCEEIGVILVNTACLSENLGARWLPLLRLMASLKREREGFHVLMEPFASL